MPSRTVLVPRFAAALASGVLLLAGCGGGAPAPVASPPTPSDSNLNGNWLLAGTLPFPGPLSLNNSNTFGLATTFSVIGNQVVGGSTVTMTCDFGGFTGGTGSAGNVVTGSIAADGTFTLASPVTQPAPFSTLQIMGAVPANGASTWKGTLNYAQNSSSCPSNQNGLAFTATRIADLTGTYTGSTSLTISTGSTVGASIPASFTFALHQGAALPGTTTVDASLLSGTVNVTGVSCFSSGSIAQSNGVLGSTFISTFTMNDGSSLRVFGDIQDTASARLAINNVSVSGSACGQLFSGPFAATRQSP